MPPSDITQCEARAARTHNYRGASSFQSAPSPFWSAAALPPLFRNNPRRKRVEREAQAGNRSFSGGLQTAIDASRSTNGGLKTAATKAI
jgi:hypothetical protein